MPIAAKLHINEVDPLCHDALALLGEAAIEASALYSELHDPTAPGPTNQPNPPRGVYLVACLDAEPVGMAAHRPIDETTTEVRRMFVKSTARRAGIARALLQKLEEHARSVGFTVLVLETGCRQVPAIALYRQYGFRRIAPFGPYQNDPTSVCFKKTINGRSPDAA